MRQGDAWIRLPEGCENDDAQLYLRPHEVRLTQAASDQAHLPFRIEAINLIGAEVRIELKPDGWECEELWEVGISHTEFNARQPQRGDRCFAVPDVGHLFCEHVAEPRTLEWR
jgi:sulfate transport system ATP-binding protein